MDVSRVSVTVCLTELYQNSLSRCILYFDQDGKVRNVSDEASVIVAKPSSQNYGYLSVIAICSCSIVGLLIVALIIISILVKRRRAKENQKELDERNSMYGRDYYQDTQIVDQNDYYRNQSLTKTS